MFRKSSLVKFMSLLIIPALLLMLTPAVALAGSTATYDDGLVTWTYTVNDDGISAAITGAALDSGVTSLGMLAIPTYVPNVAGGSYVPVTSVGGFSGIGAAAVGTVRIPRYVTALAENAFRGCSGIGNYAFDCVNLKTVGSFAFYENEALTSIDIPDTVTDLGRYTFFKDMGLVRASLPDSLTVIGDGCFQGCRYLASVNIPSRLETIGIAAFNICNSLTSIVLPDTVTFIGDYAFMSCIRLAEVTVSSGTINQQAFMYCTSLKRVTLGDGVTSLGNSVFAKDTALESLTIGAGLSAIGYNVFYNDAALAAITVSAGNPNFCSVNNVIYSKDKTTLVACAPALSGAFTAPDTVTTVAGYAFMRCTNLTSVTFPQGLLSIGDNNLSECSSLQRVVFKGACPTFGNYCMLTNPSGLTAWYPVKYSDSWSSYALTNKQPYANVTWDLRDGSTPQTAMTAVNSGLIAAPADPSRTGYAFAGWYDGASDSATKWDFATSTVSDDITLYAHWTANACTISFDSKGGSAVSGIDTVYDAAIAAPAAPALSHYTFAGWYPTAACDTEVVKFPYTAKGDTTLFAKWTPVQYTVAFNSQGGNAVDSVKADYNTAINAPAVPSFTGFKFAGWYPTEACDTDAVSFPYTVTGDAGFYAKWSIEVCDVTFDSCGGSEVPDTTADYNTKISAPINPTRGGYLFICWCKDSACTTAWDFANDAVKGDTTLYAKWFSTTAPTVSPASASYNSVKLTWTQVEGADGYEVWRASSASGAYAKAGTASSAAYTDTRLTCGKTYYYKVRAYSGSTPLYGNYSAVTSVAPLPGTPKATASRVNSSRIKVTWGAVTGASGYEVWRATSSGGTYSLRRTTTATSFTNTCLKKGTMYYYKVRAYRVVGGVKVYGGFSAPAAAKP